MEFVELAIFIAVAGFFGTYGGEALFDALEPYSNSPIAVLAALLAGAYALGFAFA